MSLSWGTIAGAFLAPYLYGLFWKGVTKAGAWSGIISGVTISILGTLIFKDEKLAPLVSSVSMLIPLLIVPVVSWFTPAYGEAHLERVFGAENTSGAGLAAVGVNSSN